MNQGLTLSILAFIGLAIFMNIQKNTIENFAGMPFPMTWKINREVTVPRCNNKPKMFSVSGNESIVCFIKIIQQALVKRKPCTENSCEYRLLGQQFAIVCTKWCLHFGFLPRKLLAYLICGNFSYTLQVAPETHPVTLNVYISQFTYPIANQAVFST